MAMQLHPLFDIDDVVNCFKFLPIKTTCANFPPTTQNVPSCRYFIHRLDLRRSEEEETSDWGPTPVSSTPG
ncbi:unnamed protein product [Pieris macdunnoughi]|uniref:Uncharacterized protein n=1 Tax=Pieris macdunnoughi TaxID=345717 RepID=A0A821S729_9NEOP|nr:unnamed protein product [Pieris macdunnoughi]